MQIFADGLGCSASRGPVYGPLTFQIGDGLTVLRGDPGSGRTSLLLTLGGRMKADTGHLTVNGFELPRKLRAVQKITAVCGFAGIDELEDSVTVGAALREREAWLSPWWGMVRKLNDVDVALRCADVFGDEAIPHADTVIWNLNEREKFLLRITLAMMNRPDVLLVDDLEQLISKGSHSILWRRLANIAATGTAVVVSASSLETQLWDALDINPTVVDLTAARTPQDAEATDQAPSAAQPIKESR